MPTKIEWTDETWNPITGCSMISPGCAHCYAERMARRLAGRYGYPQAPHHFDVTVHPDRFGRPLRWKKPRRVFVCSMGDLFHVEVSGEALSLAFNVMRRTPQHTYQVLTKRARLMHEWCRHDYVPDNVWIGVSAENQEYADARIPYLLRTPAPVQFVSVEPMLEPIELERGRYWLTEPGPRLGWVIVGCESGAGRRPCRIEWVRDLVISCRAGGVPVFVKQLDIDGHVSHDPADWPADLRMQQFPAIPPEIADPEAP